MLAMSSPLASRIVVVPDPRNVRRHTGVRAAHALRQAAGQQAAGRGRRPVRGICVQLHD